MTDEIVKLLEIKYKQFAKYYRYYPMPNGPEWQCSLDGESWWSASERLDLLT